ncbi:MAG TPA: glycosyltransferase family 4 protein [Pseudolabrys sp.]|nr:glycosyltransferase family 4 protein [Pseudolabrys sp.]
MRGRILVVDHRTPAPDRDSGSASTFSYLQILSSAGFDVTFVPFDLTSAGRYTRAIKQLGIRTIARPFSGAHMRLSRWLAARRGLWRLGFPMLERRARKTVVREAARADLVLLYRAPIALRLFDLVRAAAPRAKILFHAVDLHFLRLEREAKLSGDKEQAAEAAAMRALELDLVTRADATIVVSEYERGLLRELVPAAAVHQIPILREAPRRPAAAPDLASRRDIVFIGGFEHPPNGDAVHWFAREIWPLLRAKGFAGRFIVGGSEMPQSIAQLASGSIEVRGYVEALGPLFDACRLSVAPLRYGAGIKGKIVSSLSYGVPVVASSIAAEGTGLKHGETILVADTPRDFADEILRLSTDDDLWRRLSENGYRAFMKKFSLEAGAPKLLAVIDGLLASR